MKSTKKTLIALGIAAAMGMSASANAGVLASATFSISEFVLSNADTGNTLSITDFQSLVATNNAGVSASLTGFTSAGSTFNLAINDTNTDLSRACVGTGTCPAENNFTVLTAPATGSNFSNADQRLTGSALENVLDAEGNPIPVGANAQLRADVNLTGSATGSSDADVGLNATFRFALANDINIGVNFHGLVDLLANTDAGTNFPGNTQASSSLEIVLTELALVGFDPSGNPILEIVDDVFTFNNERGDTGCRLGRTLNRNAPINGSSTYHCEGDFSAETGTLTGGTFYQLSIRQTVEADARLVPEPGSIALMGAGVLGLGWIARRRKQK